MSTFYEEITLENPIDVGMVHRGFIKESEVHRLTVDALVDTGAWTLVLNEATREKLGVRVLEPSVAELANEVSVEGGRTEAVTVCWKNRCFSCEAIVLPHGDNCLLGALPLEGLDLIVDPKRERLIGAHGDQPLRIVK